MRIGLEITGALAGGGYRRYAESLIRALLELPDKHELFLCGVFWRGFPSRAQSLAIPRDPRVHWALRRFPQGLMFPLEEWLGLRVQQRFIRTLGLDVFHGLGSIIPRLSGIPSVVTLHYAGPWPFEKAWERFYFETLTGRSVREASRVIAISEFCKREGMKTWEIPEGKIDVVHHGGPGPEFKPGPDGREPLPGVAKPYFLFVGGTTPQKNPLLLAEAFKLFKSKGGGPQKLVFAGRQGGDHRKLLDVIAKADLQAEAVFTGPVEPAKIHALYQQADGLICPSLQEGFAFPVIEAMACGAPVIGVRAGALTETIGEAGLLVDPDPRALADAMIRLAQDQRLRGELAQKGTARAARFTWSKTAELTVASYRAAIRS